MFMVRHKAKNRLYYYLYVYEDNYECNRNKRIFSLGNGEKALMRILEWQRKNEFPKELADLGMKRSHLNKWRLKIESDFSEKSLHCLPYKDYNKNRKRPPAPTEAFS